MILSINLNLLTRPSEAEGLGGHEPPPNNFHCITTHISKIHKKNKKLPE